MVSSLTQRHCTGWLILLSLCISAGCTKQQSNVERGNNSQELYIGIGAEPSALDPHLTTGLTELYVMLAFLEGLTTVNPETGTIQPGVAKSWDISDDHIHHSGSTFRQESYQASDQN